MIVNNNNWYLMTSLTRSFDTSHKENNEMHLIGSVFYTRDLKINSFKLPVIRYLIVLKVRYVDMPMEITSHEENLIEVNVSYNHLLGRLEDWMSPTILTTLFGAKDLKRKNFTSQYVNLLFVFPDMDWLSLQTMFKGYGIKLSGGSTTRRWLLSTVDFSLIQILISLGYRLEDVYSSLEFNSSAHVARFTNLNASNIREYKLSDSLMREHLKNKLLSSLEPILEARDNKENELKIKFGNIKSLEQDLSIRKPKIEQQNKNIEKSTRIKKINANILSLKELIPKIKNEISDLELKASNIKKGIDNLSTLSSEELKTHYVSNFNNSDLKTDVLKFKDYLDKISKDMFPFRKIKRFDRNINADRSYKYYSTFSRSGMYSQSNVGGTNWILAKNSYNSNGLNKNDSVKIQTILQVRKLSLYFNKDNDLFTNNILKLLYSNETKFNIQKNIENYLMLEQNNLVLDQISKSDLNYGLLNSNITQILLDSKADLEKLYNNFIHANNVVTIQDKYDAKNVLSGVRFDFISNILFGRLFKIMSNRNRLSNYYTDVAYELGIDLINRYNYNIYTPYQPEYNSFNLFKSNRLDLILSTDNATLSVELGSILLGFLIELKLVHFKVELLEKNERKRILHIDSKLNKYIPKEKFYVFNTPKKLPMLVPPKNYLTKDGNVQLGGYLLNDITYTESLFIDNPFLVENTEVSKENKIYQMVDNINSVSFAINQQVLDFITNNHKTYNLIIEPNETHPLEMKDKLSLSDKKELESFQSRKKLEADILNLSYIFRFTSEFYLPVRLDYRGRLYCSVEYLNYQGIELAKSLLIFSKGEKVYLSDFLGISYLKIYGANCFGNKLEKKSFAERIEWINSNENNFVNFENGELISKAENKLLFIAFCFEYKKYLEALKNKDDFFITHLPIQLDATCNGFQHLSLLLNDIKLASEVNLGNANWTDGPQDFYSFLTLKSKDYFKDELIKNNTLDENTRKSYEKLSNIDYQNHRNLVKKSIMTRPYNATKYTNLKDMKLEFIFYKEDEENFYVNKTDQNLKLTHQDFSHIYDALMKCLYLHFPKLESLLDYFKVIAKISNLLGISIPWNLPSGLTVKQKFYGTKKIKLKPFIYTKDLLTLNLLDKNQFNTKKQYRALMPNIVHSLDAASLALLIDHYFKENKNKNFYSIHDCFAVPCNKVDFMVQMLKSSYYEIYSTESFLKNFDINFKNYIVSQFGQNCFKDDDTIQIINSEGEVITIQYPKIDNVLNPGNINIMESSYPIN